MKIRRVIYAVFVLYILLSIISLAVKQFGFEQSIIVNSKIVFMI